MDSGSEDDIDVCSGKSLTKSTKKPVSKNKNEKQSQKLKKMIYVMR